MARPTYHKPGGPEEPDSPVLISPFYHEARNEIVRPERGLHCTEYFLQQWAPLLGSTASLIVLYLRSLGRDIRTGEARIQVSQQQIAAVAGCSLTTLYRELKQNQALKQFVRVEERFARNAKGHVRQVENIYFIAMDEPLVPAHEPLLREVIARREQEAVAPPAAKVIVADTVVLQNDRLRGPDVVFQNEGQPQDRPPFILKDNSSSFKMTEQNPESNIGIRNVSETRSRGNSPETKPGHTSLKSIHPRPTSKAQPDTKIETWRKETEDLARYSSQELGDNNSLGYHIRVWNHARQMDRQKGGQRAVIDGVFAILQALSDRRRETGQMQGRAWTRRTRKWFEDMGLPLLVQADAQEQEAVRAALADAPFLRAGEEAREVE